MARHRQKRGKAHVTKKAVVDKNRKGFAFLVFDDKDAEDVYIPAREAIALFHGDRVLAEITRDGEVIQLEVLEHRFKELFGRYMPTMGTPKGGWVIYERKRAREEIFVPGGAPNVKSGEWVRAELKYHNSGQHLVTAKILQTYGENLPATADVELIASEFNLTERHSPAAIAEAGRINRDEGDATKMLTKALNDKFRKDLRHVPFITIDGETARDFDDAIHVERNKSGHILWVAIADVSHYVEEGSPLDKEAYSRGTSVYFPERAFHMLPRALSENLCSLRPGEPRLALVARMEFNHFGQRTGTELMEAVIESRRRATYTEIQAEWPYLPHSELFQQLQKIRKKRGSLDFDLPEAEALVDENGEPLSVRRHTRFDSHRLIEEFMIAANEAVTEWMLERQWPFIYRIHEEPSREALEKFRKLARTVGVQIATGQKDLQRTISRLLEQLEGHAAEPLLNMALLRAMKQAVYSSIHAGHFGLASRAYTHFTSPIRRYPDLIVHRLIRRALRVESGEAEPLRRREREALEEALKETAEHCCYRERLADQADREAIRLKQVRLMTKFIGDEFDAKITGMTATGIFIETNTPYTEGLIRQENFADDHYVFNEERMIFHGQRKHRTFRIGDRLRVRVIRTDIEARQIDFALAERS